MYTDLTITNLHPINKAEKLLIFYSLAFLSDFSVKSVKSYGFLYAE